MRAFFDTNVLVYAQQMDGKGDRARALFGGGGKISVQVLNEFTAVSRRKQRKDWREIDEAVADVLTMVDTPLVLTLDLHHSARGLARDHQLSFYDALIVASAIEAGCDTLFSEDMQHGRNRQPRDRQSVSRRFAVGCRGRGGIGRMSRSIW